MNAPAARLIFSAPLVTEPLMPGRLSKTARSLPTTAVHVRVSDPIVGVGAEIEAIPTVPPGPIWRPTVLVPRRRFRFDSANVTRLASLSWSAVVTFVPSKSTSTSCEATEKSAPPVSRPNRSTLEIDPATASCEPRT